MARIVINVPDPVADHADYVRDVAAMIDEGYTSGHVDRETHWTTEQEPS